MPEGNQSVTEASNPAEYFCSIQVGANQDGSTPAAPPATPPADNQMADFLRVLIEQNRELLSLTRRQYEISQRMEERFEKQMIGQREEFLRWIQETPGLAARSKVATEAIRTLLGKLIDDLVEYVDTNGEGLEDSEFVRADMVDRYGQLLSHISSMYSILKRLSTAQEGSISH